MQMEQGYIILHFILYTLYFYFTLFYKKNVSSIAATFNEDVNIFINVLQILQSFAIFRAP